MRADPHRHARPRTDTRRVVRARTGTYGRAQARTDAHRPAQVVGSDGWVEEESRVGGRKAGVEAGELAW